MHRNIDQAKAILCHYFRILFENIDRDFDNDMDTEIRFAIDAIVDEAVRRALNSIPPSLEVPFEVAE